MDDGARKFFPKLLRYYYDEMQKICFKKIVEKFSRAKQLN